MTARPCTPVAATFSMPSLGADMRAPGIDLLAVAVVDRPDDIFTGAEAVVEHHLGLAVAVDIELRAHMGERIPLRRILQVHGHEVIAHDVDERGLSDRERVGHVRLVAPLVGASTGGMRRGVSTLPPG